MRGIFVNKANDEVAVYIGNGNTPTIGEDGIYFADEPIIISNSVDDEFSHIIQSKCTVNLVTNRLLSDELYSSSARGKELKVFVHSDNVFYGYVTPNTYNQPFAKNLEEFTIEGIDFLGTLKYYNYNKCTASDYEEKKQTATVKTIREILSSILTTPNRTYYDDSRKLSNSSNDSFLNMKIHESNFYGDDYDSVWTQQEVLNEILKYFNLHIRQIQNFFYIYDNQSVKTIANIRWKTLTNDSSTTIPRDILEIRKPMFADSSTNITVDEVYNQITVNCKLDKQTQLFESPLDKDSLVSPYKGKQKYLTEIISEGEGDRAYNAFIAMMNGQPSTWKESKTVDWYAQVMTNPNWKFKISDERTIESLVETNSDGEAVNQWAIPKYLKDNQIMPSIIRMGKVETKGGSITDNSPISNISTTDYLFISVNGNENDSESNHSPSDTTLEERAPIIEYIGNSSGGVFSPNDDSTTNYLVFSGELTLMPIQKESEPKSALQPPMGKEWTTVPSDNNDDGRYYQRKWYNQEKVTDEPHVLNGQSLHPLTDDRANHLYEYNYSANGDGSDRFSKLPILECELIIGNKRLIETNIDEYGNSTFEWVTVGQEPTGSYVDENGRTVLYTITTFSLGINPKIGDYIIGDTFKLQNTIDYWQNINAEGTAIPIRKRDTLSGKITFRILGTINSLWNNITRRHPTFFRHTKWTNDSKFILAHTENVIIKDFQCKIYTDNGLIESDGEDELVYKSAEPTSYVMNNDVEFKLITQLTSNEALEKGISNSININAIVGTDNIPINGYYNTNTDEFAKGEEHYINYYYNTYNSPKLILNCCLHDEGDINHYLEPFNIYYWNILNKYFVELQREVNVRDKTITLKLREI